jgi:peptidoglycan/xylan/chitin deacetylase (PgdA/CDA1 family)
MGFVPEIVGAGVALASAAGLCTYGVVADESQMFGRTLVAPPEPGQLALTFDDGPNPAATPRLLETLAKRGARATFFLIGDYVLREPALTREIAAAGHSVGNHTMHHLWLPRHPSAKIRAELLACNAAIEQTLGAPVKLFRPPHGAKRPAVLRIANELGMQTVQWNLMVGDWKNRSAEDILQRLRNGIAANQKRGRGTNAVLHDGSQFEPRADRTATVDAVAMLLDALPLETRFVTPPQWHE